MKKITYVAVLSCLLALGGCNEEKGTDIQLPSGEKLTLEGIVVNQFHASASLPKQLTDELAAEGLPLLAAFLMSSVKMRESHQACKPLIHLDPTHKLTQQFQALFQLLEG